MNTLCILLVGAVYGWINYKIGYGVGFGEGTIAVFYAKKHGVELPNTTGYQPGQNDRN
jgi:hypothetical protein